MTDAEVMTVAGAARRFWWRQVPDDPDARKLAAAALRFWSRVERGRGCWRWRGKIQTGTGYGLIRFGRRNEHAHRVAWFLTRGTIPPGKLVRQQCGHRDCVRHLILADEPVYATKLDAEAVRIIRREAAQGTTRAALARRFGVSVSGIGHVLRDEVRAWRDVA